MMAFILLSLKTHWRWWLAIIALVVIAWMWNENARITASLNTMQSENDSNRAVTDNVLRTIKITNIVLETNQYAKQQITLESQRAQAGIKVAVADDDCARRPVPAGATDRLRQYADSIRTGSGGSDSGKPDG